MSIVLHYIHFLASEEEDIETAWNQLVSGYNLKPLDVKQFDSSLRLGGLAKREDISLSLRLMSDITTLELCISSEDVVQVLSEIEESRKKLEDDILNFVGESTLVVQQHRDTSFLTSSPMSTALADGELFIFPEDEARYRRYYVLVSQDTDKSLELVRERLLPLDCLLYQVQWQIGHYEEQRKAMLKSKEEMDRKVSEILFRKGNDVTEFETDVENLSSLYGVMANYNFLLNNALNELRSDLSKIENHLKVIVPQRDDFFHDRQLASITQFIASLSSAREDFSISLDNAKSAIDVVQSRVSLIRSKTNLGLQDRIKSLMKQNVEIQQERLTMGMAASMVEFFVVLYYGLQAWKTLVGSELFHHIPLALRAILIVAFSLSTVIGTHEAATAIKKKTMREVLLWLGVIAALLALMTGVSFLYAH